MSITSLKLLLLVVAAALALPLALAMPWGWVRRAPGLRRLPGLRQGADGPAGRIPGPVVDLVMRLGRWLAIVLAQLLAIAAVFLWANQQYGFFASWRELLPREEVIETARVEAVHPLDTSPVVKMRVSPRNPHPNGLLAKVQVGGGADSSFSEVLVWLPPQYFEKARQTTGFPVLVTLGALRQTGAQVHSQLAGSAMNLHLIQSGQASPYIAVYVGSRLTMDVDSECVDLPNGLRGQSWYTTDLVQAISQRFRTQPPGTGWFAMGFSTGGQCAALLTARHPDVYHAAANIGGYMEPVFDDPSVIAGHPELRSQNSLIVMARQRKLSSLRLLTIVSTRDSQSWGAGSKTPKDHGQRMGNIEVFEPLARAIPGVTFQLLDEGGHSDRTYLPHFPAAIAWLGTQGL